MIYDIEKITQYVENITNKSIIEKTGLGKSTVQRVRKGESVEVETLKKMTAFVQADKLQKDNILREE